VHWLTDRGSCFTADAFEEACEELKVPYWQTEPYTPQTNGMADHLNCRTASDLRGINVAGHADLEILMTSSKHAYNRRPQKCCSAICRWRKWSGASHQNTIWQSTLQSPQTMGLSKLK
jgi:hypothetical protein